ncbi:MAG: hypothetical protein AAB597_00285 [Patescibacteria group bacterium]
MRPINHFFDHLEDKVREWLSRHPFLYSLIGGVAIVLFWRGVWNTADMLQVPDFWAGVASVAVLGISGLFVSFFIGDTILISGIKREKKVIEKTEEEVRQETNTIKNIEADVAAEETALMHIRKELSSIRRIMEERAN